MGSGRGRRNSVKRSKRSSVSRKAPGLRAQKWESRARRRWRRCRESVPPKEAMVAEDCWEACE